MTTAISIPTSVTRDEDLEYYAQEALKAVDTIETYSLDRLRKLISSAQYHQAQYELDNTHYLLSDPFADENGLSGDVLPNIFPSLTLSDLYEGISLLDTELTDDEQSFFKSLDARLQAIASKL